MKICEMFDKIRIDGKPIGKVLQAQIDAERITLIYEHQREDGEPTQRAITVESEAVTIG